MRQCSEKEDAFNRNIGGPNLKLKTQASARFAIGRTPDEHPTIPRDNYRSLYFEVLNLVICHVEKGFNSQDLKYFND